MATNHFFNPGKINRAQKVVAMVVCITVSKLSIANASLHSQVGLVFIINTMHRVNMTVCDNLVCTPPKYLNTKQFNEKKPVYQRDAVTQSGYNLDNFVLKFVICY